MAICSRAFAPIFGILVGFLSVGRVSAKQDAFVEGEVLVTFVAGVSGDEASAALGKQALRFSRRFDNLSRRNQRVTGVVVDKGATTAALIARLRKDARVETAEPDYLRTVSNTSTAAAGDPDFGKLWAFQNTGQTLNGTKGSAGVDTNYFAASFLGQNPGAEIVVGVIDTGVDISHPDLAANIWVNRREIPGNGIDDDRNGYVDDVHGYDFSTSTGTMTDSGNHGTHVAGTIAAVGGNGIGVIGIDSSAKILPLKVSTDGITMRSSAVISAMNYAVGLKETGINIVAINASYGGSSPTVSERTAIEAMRDAGIILCAAAGNDGVNNDTTPTYPAAYTTSNIISVAALTQTNGLASYSNYGASSVDIAAPGSNIYSTIPLEEVPAVTTLKIGGSSHVATTLTHSSTTSGISGSIYHCGIGNAGDFPTGVRGNIALIERGTLTFASKVTNAMKAGATAVIVYDNTGDPLTTTTWTLGGSGNWIPCLQTTRATGQAILAALPASAQLSIVRDNSLAYQYLNGTSMATPCVAGAVAIAARNFPSEKMAARRSRILNHTVSVPALAGKTATGGRLDLRRIIDTDSDGLPDWWESQHFGTLGYTGNDDFNGNGVANIVEFLNGNNPAQSDSVPPGGNPAPPPVVTSLSTVSTATGRRFALTFPTIAGFTYQVEWSATLAGGSWQALGTPIAGTGSSIEVIDPADISLIPRRYYRLGRIDQ